MPDERRRDRTYHHLRNRWYRFVRRLLRRFASQDGFGTVGSSRSRLRGRFCLAADGRRDLHDVYFPWRKWLGLLPRRTGFIHPRLHAACLFNLILCPSTDMGIGEEVSTPNPV